MTQSEAQSCKPLVLIDVSPYVPPFGVAFPTRFVGWKPMSSIFLFGWPMRTYYVGRAFRAVFNRKSGANSNFDLARLAMSHCGKAAFGAFL
jgi:hypothetical protein